MNINGPMKKGQVSLSARRAWIEILSMGLDGRFKLSLSARRAWIEIRVVDGSKSSIEVALRKESVDRNFSCWLLA